MSTPFVLPLAAALRLGRFTGRAIAWSGLGLVAALGACGGNDGASPARHGTLPEFAATAPDVSIGVVEGASEYELFDVDGAIRLSDGRLVVANAGSRELRYFDPAGGFLTRAGGKGGGPGEFRYLGASLPRASTACPTRAHPPPTACAGWRRVVQVRLSGGRRRHVDSGRDSR